MLMQEGLVSLSLWLEMAFWLELKHLVEQEHSLQLWFEQEEHLVKLLVAQELSQVLAQF